MEENRKKGTVQPFNKAYGNLDEEVDGGGGNLMWHVAITSTGTSRNKRRQTLDELSCYF